MLKTDNIKKTESKQHIYYKSILIIVAGSIKCGIQPDYCI
jgi:hypothetical protein